MNRIGGDRAQAGFTIIESMIAMFFLAYIVTQLAALNIAAGRNTNLAKRVTLANQLADEAIEKSRNTAYENLGIANTSLGEACTGPDANFAYACTSTINPANPYTRVRTVSPLTSAGAPIALPSSNQADVDVTVSFTDARGAVQTIRVTSVISRY